MADGEKSKLKHKYGRIDYDYAIHLATRPPKTTDRSTWSTS